MKVKELLDSEEKWTQGHLSIDRFGNFTLPTDENAVRWCLVGAIQHCYHDSHTRTTICDKLLTLTGYSLTRFNDLHGRTFAEIRELIEKADI